MKYLLLIYGNEAGMLAASKETAEQDDRPPTAPIRRR